MNISNHQSFHADHVKRNEGHLCRNGTIIGLVELVSSFTILTHIPQYSIPILHSTPFEAGYYDDDLNLSRETTLLLWQYRPIQSLSWVSTSILMTRVFVRQTLKREKFSLAFPKND